MTFEQLKAAIGDWFATDTQRVPDTIRGQMVNMAQFDLRLLDLRFFEATASVATVASRNYSDLPTRWSRPLGMLYLTADTIKYIDYISKEEFDNRYAVCTTPGVPDHYTVYGNKIYWGPTPDGIYSMTHNYMQTLPDLVDGSPNNTNDLVSVAWPAVLFKALAYTCTFAVEDTRKSIFESEAARQENKLQIEHSRAKQTGRRPESNMPGRKY